jgi:hypothetical protein
VPLQYWYRSTAAEMRTTRVREMANIGLALRESNMRTVEQMSAGVKGDQNKVPQN